MGLTVSSSAASKVVDMNGVLASTDCGPEAAQGLLPRPRGSGPPALSPEPPAPECNRLEARFVTSCGSLPRGTEGG
jgi:hypothetical protein